MHDASVRLVTQALNLLRNCISLVGRRCSGCSAQSGCALVIVSLFASVSFAQSQNTIADRAAPNVAAASYAFLIVSLIGSGRIDSRPCIPH